MVNQFKHNNQGHNNPPLMSRVVSVGLTRVTIATGPPTIAPYTCVAGAP
jgi:hypothetical protein